MNILKMMLNVSDIYMLHIKCKNDKWTKRSRPEWFEKYLLYANKEKQNIKILLVNVREKLPEKYKNNKKIKVKDFILF